MLCRHHDWTKPPCAVASDPTARQGFAYEHPDARAVMDTALSIATSRFDTETYSHCGHGHVIFPFTQLSAHRMNGERAMEGDGPYRAEWRDSGCWRRTVRANCPRRAHRCSHLLPPYSPLLPDGFERRNFEGAPEVACDLFGRRGAEAGAELLGEWAEPWLEQ